MKPWKRWSMGMFAAFLLLMSPTMVFAKGYGGGRSYHPSYSSGYSSSYSGYGTTRGFSHSTSQYGSTYRSSSKSYSGGSTYQPSRAGSTTTRTSRSTFGGSYGYGYRGYGFYPGHFGSFFSGLFLGSMFHPFGWGFGGGYYGPYPTGGGWGGPGYSPFWSIVGVILDIFVAMIVLRIIVGIMRTVIRYRRNGSGGRAGMYRPYRGEDAFEAVDTTEETVFQRSDAHLDEQAVFDACCEYIAATRNCRPEDVDVDLIHHANGQFEAQVSIRGETNVRLSEEELGAAIQMFVAVRERVAERSVRVFLQFHPGVGVHATAQVI